MNSNQIPLPAPDVLWREAKDEIVLVSPAGGQIRVLNEMGTQIWRLMDGKHTIAAIETHLLHRYNTSPEQVRQDLQTFLADLEIRGLLLWK